MFFRFSWVYRILSGSWLFGWLIAPPIAHYQVYEYSWFHIQSGKMMESVFIRLVSGVDKLEKCAKISRFTASPLKYAGYLLLICLLLAVAFNKYSFADIKIICGSVLAIILVLEQYWRRIWENCFIYRALNWWHNTE